MYRNDLTYIHDQGYSLPAKEAASFIVELLQAKGLPTGRILDTGCGSGHSTAVFAKAGYTVIGIDRSPAMIRLARRRVPRGTFKISSRLTHAEGPWDAIVVIGEVVNYLPSRQALQEMIRRTFETLRPGGYLALDIRTPPPPDAPQEWTNGQTGRDWAVIATSSVEPAQQHLTRTITTFRKVRAQWRRGKEIHRQRLYHPVEVLHWLRSEGFRVQMRCGYGQTQIFPGGKVFIARKPLSEK